MKLKIILITILIAGILVSGCVEETAQQYSEPFDKITIADTNSLVGSLLYVADEKGFFAKEGLEVTLDSTYPHGKAMIEGVLAGKADFATGSETPFMHSGLNKDNIYIIAATVTPKSHMAVVGNKDKEIRQPQDLKGKKIAVTKGSNGEFFLDIFLRSIGISEKDVEVIHVLPNDLAVSLADGEVDAIATWFPNWAHARYLLGDSATVMHGDRHYTPFFLIGTRQDYANNNPEIIQKVIRALIKSEEFIKENPKEGFAIIKSRLSGLDTEDFLVELQINLDFSVELEQTLLLVLEAQARWAMDNNLTEASVITNYLNYIYFDALDEVKPEAVTIIH